MASQNGQMPSGPRTKEETLAILKQNLDLFTPEEKDAIQILFNMPRERAEVDEYGNIVRLGKPEGGRSRRKSRRTKRTRRR
jgi:hypothetical protein